MQFDLFGFKQPTPKPKTQVKAANWVDWVYTTEKPRPVLPNKQLINVKFRGGWNSTGTDEASKPFSYWIDDFNCFKWQDKFPLNDIVAYQLVS